MAKSYTVLALIMVTAGGASLSPVAAQTPEGLGKATITIQAELKSASNTETVLKVSAKNTGTAPVYIVTDTQRVDRSKGPYVNTDGADPSTLICSFQLYPPNPFKPFVDGTSVHLMRLEPGESHERLVKLLWPLRTTEPPFASTPGTHAIPSHTIRRIEARIGFLPASTSLARLVSRKGVPHDSFTGMERIEAGATKKSLYEIQEVARSNVVEINSK